MNIQFKREQCERFLSAFMTPGRCYEMLVLEAHNDRSTGNVVPSIRKGSVVVGWFDDPRRAMMECRRIKGCNAYLCPNPVNEDFMKKRSNRLDRVERREKGDTESKVCCADDDVTAAPYLFIDIDSDRLKGTSATDEQHAAAIELRDKILENEPSIAANAAWGSSGNGAWIAVRMAVSSPTREEADCRRAGLEALADRYGRRGIEKTYIDTNSSNFLRHLPIAGTMKCKGENTPAAPWRLVTIDGSNL